MGIGLAASLAVHILLFLGVHFYVELVPGVPAPPSTADIPEESGMRVYNLAVTDDATPLSAERPVGPVSPLRDRAQPDRDRPEPERPERDDTREAPARADRWLSPAERVRRRSVEPRVWAPIPEELLVPPDAPRTIEDVRAEIGRRVAEVNDSAAARAEADRRFRDWTVEGEDGKKWGIADGKIYLGSIALPLPVSFQPGPDAHARQTQAEEWGEIQRQSDQARVRDRFDDRVRAIRERKDRERAEKKKSGGP